MSFLGNQYIYHCMAKCQYYHYTMAGLQQVEYVTSQRGTRQILFRGYLFNKNKVRPNGIYWRCTDKTCTGRCTTVGDYIRDFTDHTHPPADATGIRFVSTLRKRAREEPTTPLPALYNDEILGQNLYLIIKLCVCVCVCV